MGRRTYVFIGLYILFSIAHAFPHELAGTWVQPSKGEAGVMFVRVDGHEGNIITGILEIRGSKDCPQPVVFRGEIEEKRVLIESSTSIVCGYGGRLTGEVVADGLDAYVGSFEYKYTLLGISLRFAHGTFRLLPAIKKE